MVARKRRHDRNRAGARQPRSHRAGMYLFPGPQPAGPGNLARGTALLSREGLPVARGHPDERQRVNWFEMSADGRLSSRSRVDVRQLLGPFLSVACCGWCCGFFGLSVPSPPLSPESRVNLPFLKAAGSSANACLRPASGWRRKSEPRPHGGASSPCGYCIRDTPGMHPGGGGACRQPRDGCQRRIPISMSWDRRAVGLSFAGVARSAAVRLIGAVRGIERLVRGRAEIDVALWSGPSRRCRFRDLFRRFRDSRVLRLGSCITCCARRLRRRIG
jgi:hypothetical protein